MALTRSFKDTVKADIRRDPSFRDGMLREGVNLFLAGEVDVAKELLRDYINATIGFEKLGRKVGISAKSLMRMFGPGGNPQARNLFAVLEALQRDAGIELHVEAAE